MTNTILKKDMMMTMIKKIKDLALEKHNLTIEDHDPLYRANRADELVWQMAGIAHALVDMETELETNYPELIPFLHYLVRNYPALKGKE